jgi:transposase
MAAFGSPVTPAARARIGTRRSPTTCHRSRDPSAKQRSAEPSEGAHRRHAEWTPTRLLREAAAIGPSTIALVERILTTKPHPEQGFRACLGILRLVRSYGPERLEAACERGMSIGANSYGSVQSILRTGLDRAFRPDPVPDDVAVAHSNIRGADYYH